MASKINPTVEHPDYEDLERKYEICDDAFEGDVADYVPPLSDQSASEYKAYVSRAAYFNMVERTVTALTGALTRKPFELSGFTEFPQTDDGNATTFIQESYRDILLGARVSFLVEVQDNKSKLVQFDADDIINWHGNGTEPGDFVIIAEETLVPSKENPFEMVCEESWRELYIDPEGFYAVRVWREATSSKDTYVFEDIEPFLVSGKRINYIPLWVSTPFDNSWEVYNPPLFTQASLNISHFRQATDLAHYAHFMALPTMTIIGDLYTYTDDEGNQTKAKLKIGSTTEALHLVSGSTAQFTEVSGSSFSMLQNEMKNTEERIYVAGSRLLSSKKGIESVEALQLRSGSESAVLNTIVHAVQSALNGALALCGEIDGVANPGIKLNTDFTAVQLDPQAVSSLLALYTAGTISIEQLLNELYSGEIIRNPAQVE